MREGRDLGSGMARVTPSLALEYAAWMRILMRRTDNRTVTVRPHSALTDAVTSQASTHGPPAWLWGLGAWAVARRLEPL